ncbi:MAG: hypothetical protein NC177_13125 [Ruminococcus flavefaciens]|nr:hypothetical protein [Ruminococcus flavefaciens]
MKKSIVAVASLLLISANSTFTITSYANNYEYHSFEYSNKDTYYSHDEYKIGTISDEKSKFSDCDLYSYETTVRNKI